MSDSGSNTEDLKKKWKKYVEKGDKIFKGKLGGKEGIYIGDFDKKKGTGTGKVYLEKNGEKKGKKKLQIHYDGEVKNFKRHGKGIGYWSKTEKTWHKGTFKNDTRCGKGNLYYKNGGVWYRGNFDSDDGKPNGWGTLFHENGHLKYRGQMSETTSKSVSEKKRARGCTSWQHGRGTEYWDNGNVKFDGYFEYGFLEGKGFKYYKTGEIKYEGDFVKGKFHGKGIWYRKNGNITYKGSFKNGKTDGRGKSYYDNGKLQCNGYRKNGNYQGFCKFYDENGRLEYVGNYYNGKRAGHGIWHKHNDDKEVLKGEFKNDNWISGYRRTKRSKSRRYQDHSYQIHYSVSFSDSGDLLSLSSISSFSISGFSISDDWDRNDSDRSSSYAYGYAYGSYQSDSSCSSSSSSSAFGTITINSS